MTNSEVYRYPHYYAIGYRWNTEAECDFIQAALKAHGPKRASSILDLGCGSGRHLLMLAERGFNATGVDLSEDMISYVKEQSASQGLKVSVSVGDLRRPDVRGPFDAAFCFMDTFRFLLTNEDIVSHLRAVAYLLAPGGLYLMDFWVPRQLDQIGNEMHQWEQTKGNTTVRVFYLQHSDSVDPAAQTFDDELVFEVSEDGSTQTIRGGRTRTRLILPQEFRALVDSSGVFAWLNSFSDFDLKKSFDPSSMTWRMVSILKKR